MSSVSAAIEVEASLAEVWDTYFDRDRWRAWVDGFARVLVADGYPEEGGSLSWESIPPGRGRVSERVLVHQPRRLHRIAFSDPESSGELETRFEIAPAPDGEPLTLVEQRLEYRLREPGPLAALTDRLFISAQMRGSLERSLTGLRAEVLAGEGLSGPD